MNRNICVIFFCKCLRTDNNQVAYRANLQATQLPTILPFTASVCSHFTGATGVSKKAGINSSSATWQPKSDQNLSQKEKKPAIILHQNCLSYVNSFTTFISILMSECIDEETKGYSPAERMFFFLVVQITKLVRQQCSLPFVIKHSLVKN